MPRFVTYDLGRAAHAEEVASWDIDVRPDGTGLPVGSGDVWTGEEVFVAQCAHCHGDFGEAVGRWPVLAGGHDTLADEHPVKTIGSYWPYLSTVYDYINRAMPFGNAQSLSADEVYAITAYLLYVNDLVDDDFELSNETFFDVSLPNEENFFLDDRAETELAAFTAEPCMSDCKPAAEITMRAAVIDVTPDEAGVVEAEPVEDDAALQPVEEATIQQASAEPDPLDTLLAMPGDVPYGEYLASECTACHLNSAAASEIPTIYGVDHDSLVINLWSYREGVRTHEVMEMIAGRLGDEEIAALSAYFASLD
ncbi:MAG: c-type cytochrome [Pseudomonadota bacterium]